MIGNVAAVTLAQWFTVSALREVSTPKTNGPQVNVLACTTYKPYFQGQSVLHALKPLLMWERLSESGGGGKVQSSNWNLKAVIRLYQRCFGLLWLLISTFTISFKQTNKWGRMFFYPHMFGLSTCSLPRKRQLRAVLFINWHGVAWQAGALLLNPIWGSLGSQVCPRCDFYCIFDTTFCVLFNYDLMTFVLSQSMIRLSV